MPSSSSSIGPLTVCIVTSSPALAPVRGHARAHPGGRPAYVSFLAPWLLVGLAVNRSTSVEGLRKRSPEMLAEWPVTSTTEGAVARRIATFASAIAHEPLPADVTTALGLRLIDSFGCALGAIEAPPVAVARRVAGRVAPAGSASILGGGSTSPEFAGIVNGIAVRYLDLNDVYLGQHEPIHPSDCIPALVAVAEAERRSGAELLSSIAVAYEVLCRLIEPVALRGRGWDHASLCAVATAAAAGTLLDLDEGRIAHAAGIAAVICPILFQTRVGELSMWKAAAAANSAQQGVLAAYLAAEGMTGPSDAFEGRAGLERVVLQAETRTHDEVGWRLPLVRTKKYAAQYYTHSAVEAAIRLRRRGLEPSAIERVIVHTFVQAKDSAANDPAKWSPRTRESADHSLPFLVAVALLDGDVGPAQFLQERIGAPDVRHLMDRVHVIVDSAYTRQFPSRTPSRVDVVGNDGSSLVEEVIVPPGHPEAPMTQADIETKCRELAKGVLSSIAVDDLLRTLRGLDSLAVIPRLWPTSSRPTEHRAPE